MKNKQGISLIVLVITIIVMIILASAIILTLNNNGIIGKANEAIDETNEDTIREMAYIAWLEAYADGVRTVEDANGKEGFENRVYAALKGIDTTKYDIEISTSGVEVSLKMGPSVVATVDGVPIPKGFVASSAIGENKKDTGLVIYEGTEAVTDANVFDAKRERNQYVWVPVGTETFDTTFVRQNFGDESYEISSEVGKENAYWEVLPTTELNAKNLNYMTKETLAEVQAMYASVKKYGGFYIARYEAGLDVGSQKTSNDGVIIKKIHSKMNKAPYGHVRWTYNEDVGPNEDTNGAVEVARSVYPKNNKKYGVVSTLVYGVQWDRTLAWWVETKAQNGTKDVTIQSSTQLNNSTKYGNYQNNAIPNSTFNSGASVSADAGITYTQIDTSYSKSSTQGHLLTTGATEEVRVNNIYDMAGNFSEWTMEGRDFYYCVHRGGAYHRDGTDFPAVNRSALGSPGEAYKSFGFRVALYIK